MAEKDFGHAPDRQDAAYLSRAEAVVASVRGLRPIANLS